MNDVDVLGVAVIVFLAMAFYAVVRLVNRAARPPEPPLPNIPPDAMRRLTDRVDRERLMNPDRQS